jgi:hypothetical protein
LKGFFGLGIDCLSLWFLVFVFTASTVDSHRSFLTKDCCCLTDSNWRVISVAFVSEYAKVKEKFDNHFIVRRNVIFERAKFNKRKQEDSENVENFVVEGLLWSRHRLSFPLISRLRLYGIDSRITQIVPH